MAVDHGSGAGHSFIDFQVQQNLAGLRPISTDLTIVQVHQGKIFHPHVAFAAQGGSADHVLAGDPGGDVAAIAVDVLPLPELPPRADDLTLDRLRRR